MEKLLVENSPHCSSPKLKNRLFKEGLKEEKCEICGYTESLELHHINGDHTDNRLENLQILCANCHRQTNNYRGKGIRAHKTADEWLISEEEHIERTAARKAKEREKCKKPAKPRKKLSPVVCPVCGKTFQPNERTQKFCSVECYRQDNSKNRPSILELIKAFKEHKSFVQVGNYFGVTDNAVRKWCLLYKLPIHTKELTEYIAQLGI